MMVLGNCGEALEEMEIMMHELASFSEMGNNLKSFIKYFNIDLHVNIQFLNFTSSRPPLVICMNDRL